MHNISHLPSRTILIDNQEYLWFGGTSYLGLAHNNTFKFLINEGLEKYGLNWGSSRNNSIKIKVFEEAENFLSEFTKAPKALTVSSGMLAGQIVVKFLSESLLNSKMIYAPKVHPALWGKNYEYSNKSFQEFILNINKIIAESAENEIIILADSVPSPHFDNYNFDWVKDLPKDKSITLVIDDSHSIGVLGENGAGIYQQINKHDNVNLIVVASLNKALGCAGGVILGSANFINSLTNYPLFSGSSPISPALAYAISKSKNVYENALLKLKSNLSIFEKSIETLGKLDQVPNHPSFCFTNKQMNMALLSKKIYTPSFAYPTQNDTPITRLTISSLHSEMDIVKLSNTLKDFFGNILPKK